MSPALRSSADAETRIHFKSAPGNSYKCELLFRHRHIFAVAPHRRVAPAPAPATAAVTATSHSNGCGLGPPDRGIQEVLWRRVSATEPKSLLNRVPSGKLPLNEVCRVKAGTVLWHLAPSTTSAGRYYHVKLAAGQTGADGDERFFFVLFWPSNAQGCVHRSIECKVFDRVGDMHFVTHNMRLQRQLFSVASRMLSTI